MWRPWAGAARTAARYRPVRLLYWGFRTCGKCADFTPGHATPGAAASMEFLWPVARHARRARQGLGANTVAGLVPLRHGTSFQAPVLARMVIGRNHRGAVFQRGTGFARGLGPVLLEIAGRRLDRLLHVAGCVFHRFLHLLELVELHGTVDFGLDIGHVALRLAQQSAHSACHARE